MNKKTIILLAASLCVLSACTTESIEEEIVLVEGVDLACSIEANTSANDMSLKIKIINLGTETIEGEDLFRYTASINGDEVFTQREDSITLESGAEFNSTYPVPRKIYKYEDSGVVSCAVDVDSEFEEANESNNSSETNYTF